MQIELINTGSELMLGRVLNSHQQWICRRLADHGYVVHRQIGIADQGQLIAQTIDEALQCADLVITTGGLGPTSDDITRDQVAQLLNLDLQEDPEVVAHIEAFFQSRHRPMPPSTRIQAQVPRGAQVIPNRFGTAPGLALRIHSSRNTRLPSGRPQWLIMLPGPPRELHPMFKDQILPLIQREYPRSADFVCKTLRTTGLGESVVEEKIRDAMAPFVEQGLTLGYCARTGEVDVRLVHEGVQALERVEQAEAQVRSLLEPHIFGTDDDSLEQVVIREALRQGKTLGLAESCTGGFLAHRLTNVPGASEVFRGGLVAYHNEVKEQVLGVSRSILVQHGAVSEACARAMAEGACRVLQADLALSVTGIAGPGGGSAEKPVGTVFLGLAVRVGGQVKSEVIQRLNPFDRETFKYVTSQQGLNWFRMALKRGMSG